MKFPSALRLPSLAASGAVAILVAQQGPLAAVASSPSDISRLPTYNLLSAQSRDSKYRDILDGSSVDIDILDYFKEEAVTPQEQASRAAAAKKAQEQQAKDAAAAKAAEAKAAAANRKKEADRARIAAEQAKVAAESAMPVKADPAPSKPTTPPKPTAAKKDAPPKAAKKEAPPKAAKKEAPPKAAKKEMPKLAEKAVPAPTAAGSGEPVKGDLVRVVSGKLKGKTGKIFSVKGETLRFAVLQIGDSFESVSVSDLELQ